MGEQDREKRLLSMSTFEIRHSGRPDEAFTIRGYPVVYGQESLDLGGFTEVIQEGALDAVLAQSPQVHFTWDHDTHYVGASTENHTLNLRSDSTGLFMDAQVGNYSWAKDLRTALERGDIGQGSFAFTVAEGGDQFDVDEDGRVLRTINQIDALYDVTVTAQGAYPQTSLAAMRSLTAAKDSSTEEEEPVVLEGGATSQPGEAIEEHPDLAALRAKALLRRQELDALRGRIDRL